VQLGGDVRQTLQLPERVDHHGGDVQLGRQPQLIVGLGHSVEQDLPW
jgi:hypothetical protein